MLKSKQALEEQQQAQVQGQQARAKHAQKAETNKWGRHLSSSVEEGAVSGEQFRTASISSTASTEQIS